MKNIHASFLPAVVIGAASFLVPAISFADNVFVSNNGNSSVTEIVDGNESTFYSGSALNGPTGVAIFGNDLFVGNNGSQDIAAFSLTDGSFLGNYATGIQNARGMVFDSAGNLYISSQSQGTIMEVPAGSAFGSTANVFATGLFSPNGLTIIGDNLYVSDGGGANAIDQVSLATGTVSSPQFIHTGLSGPNGLATAGGDLFAMNNGSSTVLEFNSNGTLIGTAVSDPANMINSKGLAIDSAGDFWVTDEGPNTVSEYAPNGTLIAVFDGFSGPNYITTQLAVPEPSTYALMAIGLGMLVMWARRKKVAATV